MSTPATRRSERKRAVNTRIADLDSSPTQRTQTASKKRKAGGTGAPRARRRQKTPEEDVPETEEDSDNETSADEEDENKELAELVIPYLTVGADPIAVADEYANSKIPERYGDGSVNAYAKLCGRDWTYYVKDKQTVRTTFGRQPDGNSRQSMGAGADHEESDDSKPVDIDLGPSKVVSRVHAELNFNSSDSKWHVQVFGRNGVKVNDTTVRRGESKPIQSGAVITIAGNQIFFQAANGKTEIHQMFIDKILEHQNNEGLDPELGSSHYHTLPERPRNLQGGTPSSSQTYIPAGYQINGQAAIAPTPAYPVRPVTPEPSPPKRAPTGSAKKRSPGYRRGIMMESTEQIDYSLDSSKDLKPACSYAAMITWAIISTPEQALSLNGIYTWIRTHYAYYRWIHSGWQNSIRHNLSLNPSFEKIARRPDEPGKGMKWRLNAENRESSLATANKNASKGGGRTSSAPGSPAGVATSSGFLPMTTANGTMKSSPTRRTPPLSSYPPTQQESFTPTRGPQIPVYAPTQSRFPVLSDETSPLPRRRTNGHLTNIDSSPTLTSGAWATDQPFRTPAPQPYNLSVPQPNTIKMPTNHMVDSSPAPFWKMDNLNSLRNTPAGLNATASPIKSARDEGVPDLPSSSPPPVASGVESPTRRLRPAAAFSPIQNESGDEEDNGIDITRGFTRISAFHEQRNNITPNSVAS